MGNESSEFYGPPIREIEPQVVLKDYSHLAMNYYPDSVGGRRALVPGLNFTSSMSGAILANKPRRRSLYTDCLRCRKQIYDGGLGKVVTCVCRHVQRRTDDNSVHSAELPDPTEFSSLFRVCNNRPPPNTTLTKLKSLTLGVFSESLDARFRLSGVVDTNRVLSECVLPFFAHYQRCVGQGDYFQTEDCCFKVLACQPSFGLVGRKTQLMITQTLSCSTLNRIHVLPLQPHTITSEFLVTHLLPYLRSGPLHLHTGQVIVLAPIAFVVAAADPDNGLMSQSTEVFSEGDSLQGLSDLQLTINIESVPPPLRSLTRTQMTWMLLHLYIVPHYRGWMRPAQSGQSLRLERLDFRVKRCWPEIGVVTEHTRIRCEIQVPQMIRMLDPHNQIIRMIDPNTGQMISVMIGPGQAPEPRHVAPDVLATLPERRLDSVPQSEDNRRCMVCLEDFEVGAWVKTLPCFHLFHRDCISEWLNRNTACPVCKTECDQV